MFPRTLPRLAATLLLLLAWRFAAAEPVVFERDAPLLAEPRPGATVAANVKRGTSGDTTVRKGPWVSVKTPGGAGWTLAFNLRYGAASSGSNVDSSLVQRLTGPGQKLSVASTIGIRGVEKEDLTGAEFDRQQLSTLEKYRTTDAQARSAAGASGLRATELEYLDKR